MELYLFGNFSSLVTQERSLHLTVVVDRPAVQMLPQPGAGVAVIISSL